MYPKSSIPPHPGQSPGAANKNPTSAPDPKIVWGHEIKLTASDWADYHARTKAELAQEAQEAEEDRWRPTGQPVQDDGARVALEDLLPDLELIDHYVYQSRDGTPLFASGQYQDNDLTRRMVLPTPHGGWEPGEPTGLRPLYRLPQVAKAGAGDLIVVLQDEDEADTAADLGFVATTCLGGARDAQKTDWSPLARRDIVVLPRNGPEGDAFIKAVTDILLNLMPRSAVRLYRPPNLHDDDGLGAWCYYQRIKSRTLMLFKLGTAFGDGVWLTPRAEAMGISLDADDVRTLPNGHVELRFSQDRMRGPGAKERLDWLHIGGTAHTVQDNETVKPDEKPYKRTAHLGDLEQDDKGRFLWPGHLVRNHLNVLSSHPKVGKTHFGLDLARRLWFHEPWPDGQPMTLPPKTKTLWVCGDRHQNELFERANAFGIPVEAILLNADFDNPHGGVNLDDPENIKGLRQRTERDKPGLILIDTIWRTTQLKMYREDDVNAFVNPLIEIAQTFDTTLLAFTHLNANDETLGKRLDGVARSILKLTQPDPEQLTRRKLEVSGNFKEPEPLGMTFKDDGFDYDDDPPAYQEKKKGGRSNTTMVRARTFILDALAESNNLVVTDLRDLCIERKIASKGTFYTALDGLKLEGLAETSGGAGTGQQYVLHRTDKTPSKNSKNLSP